MDSEPSPTQFQRHHLSLRSLHRLLEHATQTEEITVFYVPAHATNKCTLLYRCKASIESSKRLRRFALETNDYPFIGERPKPQDPRYTFMCDVVKELNARLRVRAKLLSVLTSDKVEWFWEAE